MTAVSIQYVDQPASFAFTKKNEAKIPAIIGTLDVVFGESNR
jgi:hypothetical protein